MTLSQLVEAKTKIQQIAEHLDGLDPKERREQTLALDGKRQEELYAMAAEAPPLEPPGVRFRSQGFRVIPKTRLSVTPFHPNSGEFVRPMRIAPAARNRSIRGASTEVTSFSSNFEPNVVRQPLT